MNFETIKDPLIVSALFFVAASDWFDNWLKDIFPSLRTSNPIVFGLIKTAVFAIMYWLYQLFIKKNQSQQPAIAGQPRVTASAGNNSN